MLMGMGSLWGDQFDFCELSKLSPQIAPQSRADELDTADAAVREQVLREFHRIRAENDALATELRLVDDLWSETDGPS